MWSVLTGSLIYTWQNNLTFLIREISVKTLVIFRKLAVSNEICRTGEHVAGDTAHLTKAWLKAHRESTDETPALARPIGRNPPPDRIHLPSIVGLLMHLSGVIKARFVLFVSSHRKKACAATRRVAAMCSRINEIGRLVKYRKYIPRTCCSVEAKPVTHDRCVGADFSMTHDRFSSADNVGRQYRPIFVDRAS